MKRRSINDGESPPFVDDIPSNSTEFEASAHGNNAVGDSSTADSVVSNSADMFLNQMSYSGIDCENGLSCLKRSSLKKSKRRPMKTGSTDNKSNNNHDHPDLSSLIASELTKLSIEDRMKALEEIHGVVEAIEEDPEEIKNLLEQIKEEVKRIRYKQAYEKAAFLSSAYVNDPEFVLHFLRADNYNPRPAAIRLVDHFKYKLEVFGEDTLVRDIMYDDLTDDEKTVLNSGFCQTLPASDRAGRQIVVCNLSEFLKVGNLRNVVRAMWYLVIRNNQMNTASSKMGIVGVYFAHGMGNIFHKLHKNDFVNGTGFMQTALPVKLASIHFCFDDTSTFGSMIRNYLMMTLGKCARIRLRSHCGSRLECRYALKSFGIDVDPFERAGSIALSDSVQGVIERCREFDIYHQKKLDAKLLPRPNDVLLGRGRPFQLYSGNLALTIRIDENRARYMASKKRDKKIITSEIVESIRQSGGQFLKKVNKEDGSDVDWEVVDFETSRLKVSHSFRTLSRWQSDIDADAWNHTGTGDGEILADSIPSISTEESNADPLTTDINFSSATKKRKNI